MEAIEKRKEESLDSGTTIEKGGNVISARMKRADLYKKLFHDFNSALEALDWLKKSSLVDFVQHGKSLRVALTEHYMPQEAIYFKTFKEPFYQWEKEKKLTMVVYGKTGLGKTAWAKAHFKCPVLLSLKDDLKKITSETDGFIYDDMQTNHLSATELLRLVDGTVHRSFDVKYAMVTLQAGRRLIITLNTLDLFWPANCPEEVVDAIKRRVHFKHVTESLFDVSKKRDPPIYKRKRLNKLKLKCPRAPRKNVKFAQTLRPEGSSEESDSSEPEVMDLDDNSDVIDSQCFSPVSEVEIDQ